MEKRGAAMDWLCGLSGVLLVVLLVVTVVGHGMWVILAALFGSRAKTLPQHKQPPDDLAKTETQLARLLQAGLLDDQTYDKVISAVGRLRRGQATPIPPVPALPVEVAPAIVLPATPVEATVAPTPAAVERTPATPLTLPAARPEPPPRPKPVQPPKPPAKPMSEVLAAFMRQSNIRWGELIGGLLIIGGSIALVVSFWNQIAGKPFFQFGIFTTVTTALMGLGLYAEHRWKLPTTSRGILLIATLLAPLNFVAFAALSHGARAIPQVTIAEIAALALFGFLITRAARVLSPYWPELLSIGVIGQCASLVLTKHLGPAHSTWLLWLLAIIPVGIHEVVLAALLSIAVRWKKVREHAAEAMLLLLGVMTFATALAVGLVIFQVESPWHAAHVLAPLLSLAAVPGLVAGLLPWRGITDKKMASMRTTGTAIALVSAGVMLGAVWLAWPDPAQMLPLAAIDFVALTAIGLLFEFPAAHLLAGPCLLLAYLLAFHLLRHNNVGWTARADQMLTALSNPSGGGALVVLAGLVAAGGATLRRSAKTPHAQMYWGVAAGIAAISLALASISFGRPGDPNGATWVYLIYAVAAVITAWRVNRREAGWAGCVLSAAAVVQFILTRTSISQPWPTALLAYATAATIGVVLFAAARRQIDSIQVPARGTAFVASLAALAVLIFGASLPAIGLIALRLFWISGLWFVLALLEDSGETFVAAQVVLFVSIAMRVVASISKAAWFNQVDLPLLDPRALQPLGLALGVIAIAFAALRTFLPATLKARRPRCAAEAFDRIVTLVLALGLGAIVLAAAIPAIQIEYLDAAHRTVFSPWASHAITSRSWELLAVVLLALCLWARQTMSRNVFVGLIAVAAIACPLWAARWAGMGAAGSALRWSASLFLVTTSIPLGVRERMPGVLGERLLDGRLRSDVRALLVALCAVPILLLSIYPASLTLSGYHFAGPSAWCFFGRIGNSVSYLIPLLVLAGVFVSYGVCERSTIWALSAAGVFNLAVTLGYALAVVSRGGSIGTIELIRLVQLNVIALAVFAIGWQAARLVIYRRESELDTPAALWLVLGLCGAGNLLLIIPGALYLLADPATQSAQLLAIGSPLGWLTVLATLAALTLPVRRSGKRMSPRVIAPLLVTACFIVAFSAEAWGQGQWLSFHLAMAALVLATGGMPALEMWIAKRRQEVIQATPTAESVPRTEPTTEATPIPLQYLRGDRSTGPAAVVSPSILRWTAGLTTLAVIFAFRSMLGDPQRPWWSATSSLLLSALWISVACWAIAPRHLYAGAALLNLAVSFWSVDNFTGSSEPLMDLLLANVAVLALFGIASMVVYLDVLRPRLKRDARLPVYRFASALCTSVMVITGIAVIEGTLLARPYHPAPLLLWGAWAATLAAAFASLWDARSRYAIVQMYALGLGAIALALGASLIPREELYAIAALLVGGFVLVIGEMIGIAPTLRRWARSLGIPDESAPSISWVLPANLVLAGIVAALALAGDFSLTQRRFRIATAIGALLQLPGLLLATRNRREGFRGTIVILAAAAVIAIGWAFMDPARAGVLDRAVVSMVVLVLAGASCYAGSTLLAARESAWPATLRRSAKWSGLAWAVNLCSILGLEVAEHFAERHVIMSPASIAAVIVSILAAATVAIVLALRHRPDPFGVPDVRRVGYVYGAEGLLALLFVHLRVTMPWLFGGILAQYWPLLVMALAFGGVALSELFRRRNVQVLSDPLLRTGIFLPLLPVLAFWAAPSKVEFSNVLFTVGLFYAILSATRHSFILGVLAALAANGGLWALLYHHPQLGFLVHPQLWLIPAALSVLAAAHLNRDRLTLQQIRFVRYCCLMVIYVASTADVFINGVASHPVLPLVLTVLSVAGVVSGIILRLRAFLFLGTAFLVLSIGTMIEFASVNFGWTWLWWLSVILMGLIILIGVALIEKKRADMIAIVEGLKQWQ